MNFWGVVIRGGEKYEEIVQAADALILSNVSLQSEDSNSTTLSIETEEFPKLNICTLAKGRTEQFKTDLLFENGRIIKFNATGKGTLSLTGFLVSNEDEDGLGEFSDSEDEFQAEVADAKKRAAHFKTNGQNKKQKVEDASAKKVIAEKPKEKIPKKKESPKKAQEPKETPKKDEKPKEKKEKSKKETPKKDEKVAAETPKATPAKKEKSTPAKKETKAEDTPKKEKTTPAKKETKAEEKVAETPKATPAKKDKATPAKKETKAEVTPKKDEKAATGTPKKKKETPKKEKSETPKAKKTPKKE